MIKKISIVCFVFVGSCFMAQPCKEQPVGDSVYKPSENKKVLATVLNCPLKNGGNIQFVNQNGNLFLKLFMNDKFGFEEVGAMELKSGTKSFFVKLTDHYDIKKPQPYFIVEIHINYVATLKENGLTSVVFNKFESKLTKQDTENIEKTANCFYSLNSKK